MLGSAPACDRSEVGRRTDRRSIAEKTTWTKPLRFGRAIALWGLNRRANNSSVLLFRSSRNPARLQLPCRTMSPSQSTAKWFRPSPFVGSAAAGRGWRRDLLERGFRRTTSSNASPHTGKRCATRQCPLTYNPAIRYAQRSNPGRGFREVQRRAGDTGQPSEARPLCVGGRPVRHSIARYRVGKIRYRPGAGNHRRQETRAPPHS